MDAQFLSDLRHHALWRWGGLICRLPGRPPVNTVETDRLLGGQFREVAAMLQMLDHIRSWPFWLSRSFGWLCLGT